MNVAILMGRSLAKIHIKWKGIHNFYISCTENKR